MPRREPSGNRTGSTGSRSEPNWRPCAARCGARSAGKGRWIVVGGRRSAGTAILRPEDGIGKPLLRARQHALIRAKRKALPSAHRYMPLRMPGSLAELKRLRAGMSLRKRHELRQAVLWGQTDFLLGE